MNKLFITLSDLSIKKLLLLASSILSVSISSLSADPTPSLDPTTIPKFVEELHIPAVFKPTFENDPTIGKPVANYNVTAKKITQQILPHNFPKTTVFAYGGRCNKKNHNPQEQNHHDDPNVIFSYPGPTFEANVGNPIFVQWNNNLTGDHIFPVDPTLNFANPNGMDTPQPPFLNSPPGYSQAQNPIPMVSHLHGGVTPSRSDGHPLAWFTENQSITGPTFFSSLYHYYNAQLPATLFYHDHSMGMTRLNVAAGLMGLYIIRDPHDPIAHFLPSGDHEISLLIQDRSFNSDGSLFFTQVGDNPSIHPYWDPEFFGNTILVNGKTWPNLSVDKAQYRFRIINGSNARFYNIKISDGSNLISFIQIGGDGSYLPSPVELTQLRIAPAERVDILVDFSKMIDGEKLLMTNDAPAPYPSGDLPDPNTTGLIMQFTVQHGKPTPPHKLPKTLIQIPKLSTTIPPKLFTLNEAEGDNGPLSVLIDGQIFMSPTTELPNVGTTEEWYFQNLTEDSHPIHIHLVQFQLEDRQAFDVEAFTAQWELLNGTTLPLNQPTQRLSVEDPNFKFLTGPVEEPSPSESGWKDTFVAEAGKVTRVLVRFAPQYSNESDLSPGVNPFPFDPTIGPGYVWHCHILDHEDNDMMRPMEIQQIPQP